MSVLVLFEKNSWKQFADWCITKSVDFTKFFKEIIQIVWQKLRLINYELISRNFSFYVSKEWIFGYQKLKCGVTIGICVVVIKDQPKFATLFIYETNLWKMCQLYIDSYM